MGAHHVSSHWSSLQGCLQEAPSFGAAFWKELLNNSTVVKALQMTFHQQLHVTMQNFQDTGFGNHRHLTHTSHIWWHVYKDSCIFCWVQAAQWQNEEQNCSKGATWLNQMWWCLHAKMTDHPVKQRLTNLGNVMKFSWTNFNCRIWTKRVVSKHNDVDFDQGLCQLGTTKTLQGFEMMGTVNCSRSACLQFSWCWISGAPWQQLKLGFESGICHHLLLRQPFLWHLLPKSEKHSSEVCTFGCFPQSSWSRSGRQDCCKQQTSHWSCLLTKTQGEAMQITCICNFSSPSCSVPMEDSICKHFRDLSTSCASRLSALVWEWDLLSEAKGLQKFARFIKMSKDRTKVSL